MTPPVLAWHFLPDDGKTRFKPRQTVFVGQTLKVDPDQLRVCSYGLHASLRLIDALSYAPGATICRVELLGKIISQADKLCASERRVVAMADATNVLHEMACHSAESVFKYIQNKEHLKAAKAAVTAKRGWVSGKITSEELDAAWAAAGDAAWDAAGAAARDAAGAAAWAAAGAAAWDAAGTAAWAAARDAARDAAWAAAGAAAWDAAGAAAWAAAGAAAGAAARDAARAAAWAAAGDAAWDAAGAAAWDAAGAAARDAAWDAARAAAWAAQNRTLTKLVYELLNLKEE